MVHTEDEIENDENDGVEEPDGEVPPPAKGKAKPRRFTEEHDVKLTKAEWEKACEDFAHALEQRDAIADAAATSAANFKARLKLEDDRVEELKNLVGKRKRRQSVELQERFIHQTGTCEIVRCDTGEKIRERPMTAEERRQPDLPGVEA